MVSKKLAGLLAAAVMLGQASLPATLFAQADTQVPLSSLVMSQTQNLQVATVIPHTGIEALPGNSQEGVRRPSTPDIYTIGGGAGKLPTIIQVLPQDGNTTSLFVNGTEILRFQGTVANMDAYSRVKAVADRLNRMLTIEAEAFGKLRPMLQSADGQKQVVIALGDDVLATVDASTAKAAQETQPKLAFLYTNRLRQVLGVAPLKAQALASFLDGTGAAQAHYKGTGRTMVGMASWYGGFFHGRRAADGSRFNMNALTAAHKTLPFGTLLKVVNQRNHKSCFVKITDRGPYAAGRIIDLSRGAATAIGMLGSGVARVSLEVVKHSS
jgi:rare lipoprotein A